MGGSFPLLSPTERSEPKQPADNASHGDRHAEMSGRSGALSDVASDKKKLARAVLTIKQGEVSQGYTNVEFSQTQQEKQTEEKDLLNQHRHFYSIKSFQASRFFSLHSIPLFFSLRISHNEIYSIRGNV